MHVPNGMTEEEVLLILQTLVKKIARSYVFGYYDIDDIKQEAIIEGLKVLPQYQPFDEKGKGRPLVNFLYVHIKRRLLNLLRNKFKRMDTPCLICHEGRHFDHDDGKICQKYSIWKKLNGDKANLTRPLAIHNIDEDKESNIEIEDTVERDISINELKNKIDQNLDPSLRNDYLRMLAKEKIPSTRRKKVEEAIREILGQDYASQI